MAYAPPNEDTYHFVGGPGTQADKSDMNAGGCTKAVWTGTLTDFMGANGGPVTSAVNATYDHTGGAAECMVSAAGIGTGVTVGTLAYVTGTNITAGVYEITSKAGDGSWVAFANIDATGDNADTTINVGGALDCLQNALDNDSTDAADYNRTIFTNLAETGLSAAINPDQGFGGASTYKRVVGFGTTIDDGIQVTLTGDGSDDGIHFNVTVVNMIFENIILTGFVNGWLFDTATSITGIYLINCQGNSNSANGLSIRRGYKFTFIDCEFNNNTERGFYNNCVTSSQAHYLRNCITHGNGKEGFYAYASYGYGNAFFDCIAYGNGTGETKYDGFYIFSQRGNNVVDNCISYANGKYGFEFATSAGLAINCIAKDNTNKGFYQATGYATLVDYCCSHGNGTAQYDLLLDERHSISSDPEFVDAANADFRLKPTSPCLNTGKPTMAGDGADGFTSMGAWQRKSFLGID